MNCGGAGARVGGAKTVVGCWSLVAGGTRQLLVAGSWLGNRPRYVESSLYRRSNFKRAANGATNKDARALRRGRWASDAIAGGVPILWAESLRLSRAERNSIMTSESTSRPRAIAYIDGSNLVLNSCWSLVAGCWWHKTVVGCWMLVAGGAKRLLVAGCWLLVAQDSCWLLVAHTGADALAAGGATKR